MTKYNVSFLDAEFGVLEVRPYQSESLRTLMRALLENENFPDGTAQLSIELDDD